jgi:hypothetical protein
MWLTFIGLQPAAGEHLPHVANAAVHRQLAAVFGAHNLGHTVVTVASDDVLPAASPTRTGCFSTAALYSRSLRHRRCHNVVTTRCEFGELTADGMRRFPLVRSVRESFREYSLPASVARVVRQAKSVVARLATR